ncbi:PREDICTED: uncharacterized acetyltransferase At3g50280-like [Ipomoea nil]|uniref:uncharacterized acetyltransferase At3g50280-like n=1 Tax=Ipomoea nil TaxID=35883 RepID=UPI000901A0D9|nr:PREDICTED: uncharacterized acetyltransferase At3g50280-like [Ipomoea nil]
MGEEVEVISKCFVGAAGAARSNGVSRRVELTPWDLQFLQIGPIQKGLLFHNPTPQQQQQFFNSNLIHHLKTSLSSTLDFFPPLAGRFATVMNEEDNTCSVYVDCNNAGVEFVEAKASGVTVAAILDQSNINVPQILRSLFTLNGILNRDGICKPLMGVQITELLDGYFIACTLNHSLGDGTSFWNFFNSWAELSRGFHQPSTTPIHERWFPDNTTTCPVHLPPMIESSERLPPPQRAFLAERVFHLSKVNIARLKEKANSEMGTSIISSLQSYMAHLWRAVTRARHLDSNEHVHLFLGIGTRPRIPLPEGYWGNGFYFKKVTLKAGEVVGKGVGWVAWQIKEAVQEQSHEEAMKQYKKWVESPALVGGELFSANTLGISSSPWFNVYATDFGWGKPVQVRSGGGNKLDGKVTLFGGCEEGSVDIELSIHPHTLHQLENDPEFLQYVTIS